jgi:hypothetical protein
VSLCAVTIEIGRRASAAAAPSPAVRPNSRRTRSYTSGTASTPAIASGRRTATELNPKSCVLATCSQRSTGVLSIDTCAAGSKAP